eukprot:NODE_6274_length_904_cov_45.010243_g5682_i0.p1 GENE.NODE_6274_length_904_cov_45.010243_g5682_i0~~NODE_6274_length_904_cov_45.010243_g5682_i0.p1  ORF type:complete len:259 (+),score=59.15 NODE_6274_length_904_cov_45.010243_g5682_i0:43-819(+)
MTDQDIPSEPNNEIVNNTKLDIDEIIKLATAHKEEGNQEFKSANFAQAIDLYTQAIDLLQPSAPALPKPPPYQPKHNRKDKENPEEPPPPPPPEEPEAPLSPDIQQLCELLATCLGNRAACHMNLKHFDSTITDCTDALKRKPKYLKLLLRRAEAAEQLAQGFISTNDACEACSKLQMAVEDYKEALKLDSNQPQVRIKLSKLEPMLAVWSEKMKDEMLDKLKGVGNFFLGKLGLSLDNFQTTRDPSTGNMNIQFVNK